MRATYYQVLGIPPNAKIRQIRASIRTMLMTATLLPYLKEEQSLPESFKAPDVSGDLLCFAHHASVTLLDAKHRDHYDQCIAKNVHRQNLNQNRYQMLLQYTGGATRRPEILNMSGVRMMHEAGHLGLLSVGFQWPCEEYLACVRGICIYGITLAVLSFQIVWIWKGLLGPYLHKGNSWWWLYAISVLKTLLILGLGMGCILAAYALRRRPEEVVGEGVEENTILDSATWTMLELAESWRYSDRVFVGDVPIHEDSAWVFRIRMSHLARSEVGMSAFPAPWRRFWARTLDMACWGSICLVPVYYGLFDSIRWLKTNPALASVVWLWYTITSWVVVEACLLSLFETTLGRCLAGVTLHFQTTTLIPVKAGDFRKLFYFPIALKRTWALWWYGLGAGILPITVWCVAKFFTVCKKKIEPQWDAHADVIVMVHPVSVVYSILGIGLLVSLIFAWMFVFLGKM